ncbi:MAG: hypothetical protein N2376_12005 [Clostridia bacterium]|nr:hypothetical protein [Clostridia bacterium]
MSMMTYETFIERVEALGFMAFSPTLPGWTSLTEETSPNQWHTSDPDTDPWQWKDRAAQENRLAFGCLFNGHKGFVSKAWYPCFYAAYRPEASLEERWEKGMVNQNVLKVWRLFDRHEVLSTDDIRSALGVKKTGASAVDNAVKTLQKEFYITVAGNRRKVNKLGEPYGWPSNTYQVVEDWAPADWLKGEPALDKSKARQRILEAVCSQSEAPDIKKVYKTLGL